MHADPLVCVEVDEVVSLEDWESVIVFGRHEEVPDTPEYRDPLEGWLHNVLQRKGLSWEPGYVKTIFRGAERPLEPTSIASISPRRPAIAQQPDLKTTRQFMSYDSHQRATGFPRQARTRAPRRRGPATAKETTRGVRSFPRSHGARGQGLPGFRRKHIAKSKPPPAPKSSPAPRLPGILERDSEKACPHCSARSQPHCSCLAA